MMGGSKTHVFIYFWAPENILHCMKTAVTAQQFMQNACQILWIKAEIFYLNPMLIIWYKTTKIAFVQKYTDQMSWKIWKSCQL